MFLQKLISCPWNAGVPAASQKECETKVARTRNANSAIADRCGKMPNARANPAISSSARPLNHHHRHETRRCAALDKFAGRNQLIDDSERVQQKNHCDQNSRC